MGDENDEREWRRTNRYECMGDAEVRIAVAKPVVHATVRNLSRGGCFLAFQTNQDLELGDTVEVSFNVRNTPMRMCGTVKFIRSAREIGIEFAAGGRLMHWQLEELTEELAAALRHRLILVKR